MAYFETRLSMDSGYATMPQGATENVSAGDRYSNLSLSAKITRKWCKVTVALGDPLYGGRCRRREVEENSKREKERSGGGRRGLPLNKCDRSVHEACSVTLLANKPAAAAASCSDLYGRGRNFNVVRTPHITRVSSSNNLLRHRH